MFFTSPEEYEKAQMEHTRLVLQTRSDIKDLISNMSIPDLLTFKKVLHTIVAVEDDGAKVAAFIEGQCSAVLQYVHEVCPGCGKDHVQEIVDEILPDEVVDCATKEEQAMPGLNEGDSQ